MGREETCLTLVPTLGRVEGGLAMVICVDRECVRAARGLFYSCPGWSLGGALSCPCCGLRW